jgi:hypothetical protein
MTLWVNRDLPVLYHLAEHPPQHRYLWTQSRSWQPRPELPELTEAEFHQAVEVLSDAGYVSSSAPEYEGGGGAGWGDILVTGTGMQVLGEWPLFESLGDPERLATLLRALAERAPTEEEAGNLRAAADRACGLAVSSLRALLLGAADAWVRARLGL